MNSINPTENSSPTAQNESSSGIKKTVTEAARSTTAKIKSTAQHAVEDVQKTVAEKKSKAAERVEAYSSSIHESARAFEEQDPNIAWFTHQAADRLQRVGAYVRDRDFQGLRQDAENLARRHPVAFFGGMCVLGLILGNIVKASTKNLAGGQGDDEYAPNIGAQPQEDYAPQPFSQTASAEI